MARSTQASPASSRVGRWHPPQFTKVEIFVDGVYEFDAPYETARGDVGGAFPDVENATNSALFVVLCLQSFECWRTHNYSCGPF